MKFSPSLRFAAVILPIILLAAPRAAFAEDPKAAQDSITRLLKEFLAKNDDPAQHDRFWADDLVYTSSKGDVTNKPDIMKALTASKADPNEPKETYAAEDILVRPYGTTAALTFRLVRHTSDGKLQYYRNSGTLLLRNGRWQVVTWQATKIPDAESISSK
jgi:hypothetical protein